MTTYVARAEAKVDADCLLDRFSQQKIPVERFVIESLGGVGDVVVEFDTNVTLGDVLDTIATVPDGHIMYRTVRAGTRADRFDDDLRRESY